MIHKTTEPTTFSEWKAQANEGWQPSWDTLQTPEKPKLHQALAEEQGWVCCYCESRINTQDSHIEHYRPKGKRPDLELDYLNLYASCGRPSYHSAMPSHCGNQKKDWYEETMESIIASPLEAECQILFRYNGNGEILAIDDPYLGIKAQRTIEILALDDSSLNSQRQEAIDGLIEILSGATEEEVEISLQRLMALSDFGQHTPFATTLIYFVQHYYVAS